MQRKEKLVREPATRRFSDVAIGIRMVPIFIPSPPLSLRNNTKTFHTTPPIVKASAPKPYGL
jgi:hypothetical protein